MKIYLLRHGIAQDIFEVPTDALRALTQKGIARARHATRGLAAIGCRPAWIVTSPLVRARQTAEIAAKILAPGIEIEESVQLTPDTPVEETMDWLKNYSEDDILLTGHMPHLAGLATVLLSGNEGGWIDFRKSGACAIGIHGRPGPGRGILHWLLEPDHLAELGTD